MSITCRYLDRLRNQCTGEAVDPDGELLLCVRHLALALEMVRAAVITERMTTDVPAKPAVRVDVRSAA